MKRFLYLKYGDSRILAVVFVFTVQTNTPETSLLAKKLNFPNSFPHLQAAGKAKQFQG